MPTKEQLDYAGLPHQQLDGLRTTVGPHRLTPRQAAILRFLGEYMAEHGYQPTYREVMDHFGFKSPNGVHAHFRLLAAKGVLTLATADGSPQQSGTRAVIFSGLAGAIAPAVRAYFDRLIEGEKS